MIGIVISTEDRASETICEHLLEVGEWTCVSDPKRSHPAAHEEVYRTDGFELRRFDALHLSLEDAADAFDRPDIVVFASRHSGETGALLSAHHPGNFGPAEYGGSDRALAEACPNAHTAVIDALAEHAPPEYDVGMECTHHGPTAVGAPALFVEIGSGPDQWADEDAGRALARSILDLRGVAPHRPADGEGERRHLVGFDGNHYCPRFERIVRETDWSVGHVAADWALDAMGDPREHEGVLREAFTRSKARHALIDGDRPALEDTLESLGYEVVSETWLRAIEGVPLPFARRLEDRLIEVEAGLRFGEPATDYDGEITVVEMPKALLERAQGIDQTATRTAIEEVALAFETDHGGTRMATRIAIPEDTDRSEVIDRLVGVLRSEYDDVTIEADCVIARTVAFDPGLATEAGVPEGPKFGMLAEGNPVEVDGERIDPEDVRREREDEFPI